MWLFLQDGAFSVIQWHDGRMCVRARMPGDIERLREYMPALGEESMSPQKDYRYRAFVDREGLREGMANIADSITYGNFKSQVESTKRPSFYKRGLHDIWSVMASWQPGGAYGVGKGQPIPKDERELTERLTAEVVKAKSGHPCEDCGVQRDDSEMEVFAGRWLCRDVELCDRSRATAKLF